MFCQSLEENPKCHSQMKGNGLGCSGITQKPTRLRPTMNLKQWKNTGTPVSLSTNKQVSHHHKHKVCRTRKKSALSRLAEICSQMPSRQVCNQMGLSVHNDKTYVWSTKGEGFKPKNTAVTVKHGDGSITRWSHSASLQINGYMVETWIKLGIPTGQQSQMHIKTGF